MIMFEVMYIPMYVISSENVSRNDCIFTIDPHDAKVFTNLIYTTVNHPSEMFFHF